MKEKEIRYVMVYRKGGKMIVNAVRDDVIIGEYKGFFDGNVVRLYINKRVDPKAEGRVRIDPRMIEEKTYG